MSDPHFGPQIPGIRGGPTAVSQTCSHCHTMNRIYPGITNVCASCLHRADLPRLDCTCARCTPPILGRADQLRADRERAARHFPALLEAALRVLEELDRFRADDSHVYPDDLVDLVDCDLRRAVEAMRSKP